MSELLAQSYVPEFTNEKIKVKPVVDIKAFAFNLKDVRLHDSPFKQAMDWDAEYLLALEPDRFLHRHRKNAGLEPKAEIYGGWENLGVSGFTLGHYISALAMYYAATGDEQFKIRTDYITDELAHMQDLRKNGYVGGIPEEDRIWDEIASGDIRSEGFDLNGGWVPLYTVHKLMAGLVDAYLYAENEKALNVVTKMSDWLYDLTKALSEEQMEQIMFCEFGGMNDVLAHIYAITGNKKYLDLSYRFNHKLIMDPLAREEDQLNGIHANTQIPKLIGNASQYELTGDKEAYTAASFFWQTVIDNHTYVIGGNSDHEMFGEPGKLSHRLSSNTTETCNTYNMLKLTRHLFAWNPVAYYSDYYERGLYNHILASQNPESGMMCYYVPLKMGGIKTYNTPFDSFWCCTGTGMENHVKYGENIYARGKDGSLFVNLFIPSELNWEERGVQIIQETEYPLKEQVRLSIKSALESSFIIHIRQPDWAKEGVQVLVNGEEIAVKPSNDGYLSLNRTWKNNDVIELKFPMSFYTESMPDNINRISILYGPLVMAGILEKDESDKDIDPTVLIGEKENFLSSVVPVTDQSLTFKTESISNPEDVTIVPFYQVHDQFYNVYWDLFTENEWSENRKNYKAEKERIEKLEAKTVDHVRVGEQQPEVDHNFKGEKTKSGHFNGQRWRQATEGGWFSYEMKVDPKKKNTVILTLKSNDEGKDFEVYIDDHKISALPREMKTFEDFFEVHYPIPKKLSSAKQNLVIKIQAQNKEKTRAVFECRIIKE
ncbi:MAG: glycoside hydrolase family 127 protein [Bacteroidota bacterium]|nr:glycoside hydrolase family 127 protein [Bacteroidota bacterium]